MRLFWAPTKLLVVKAMFVVIFIACQYNEWVIKSCLGVFGPANTVTLYCFISNKVIADILNNCCGKILLHTPIIINMLKPMVFVHIGQHTLAIDSGLKFEY